MSTYYVATNGSDSNPGTSGLPFLTIQKAANVVNPGDTVIVRDGTYQASSTYMVVITATGTSDNPIVFRSENKYGAILDGGNLTDGICFVITGGASYIKIQDFEIKNFLRHGIDIGQIGYISQYITIEGNKIRDIGRIIDDQDYGRTGLYMSAGNHHLNFTRNLVYNIGRTGPNSYYMNKDHAVYLAGTENRENASHHNTITYNIMYNCSGVAITAGADDDVYANNVMAWSNYNSQGGSAMLGIDEYTVRLSIINNIFLLDEYDENYVIWTPPNPTYSGWSIKNNMVYAGRMNVYQNSYTLAAMDGGNYGQTDCEHSQVNPLFISAIRGATPDFHLQAGSPAINAGFNLGLSYDFDNNSVSNPPEIGVYEKQSAIYYNIQKSGTATRNNCGEGYAGSTATYIVLAGTYSSVISQVDADNQAQTDVDTNKQSYANTNGTCTLIPIWYNTEQSGTAIRNNCGQGYTGSEVTYIVPAGTYNSLVSQEDANAQATADVTMNKQAYANTHGTCATIIYYNMAISQQFTKNNCSSGFTSSTVTYTVASGTYMSYISQADANAQAQMDIDTNGQTYANTNGTCTQTTFYNVKQTGTSTRNNCGTGYTGSTVVYTIPAGTYSSTISQKDADDKAIADINANKQAYANSHGTCTAQTIYYNTKVSATATRNNCPRCYVGSKVTYTVSAGTYTSLISQSDAQAKANADLSKNKQVYANSNGTCTRRSSWWWFWCF
jgi:hypothetical protein